MELIKRHLEILEAERTEELRMIDFYNRIYSAGIAAHSKTLRSVEEKIKQVEAELSAYERNKRGHVTVRYLHETRKYVVNILFANGHQEEWILPAWKRYRIRVLISRDSGIKIPWKQIDFGQTWTVDTNLSSIFINRLLESTKETSGETTNKPAVAPAKLREPEATP